MLCSPTKVRVGADATLTYFDSSSNKLETSEIECQTLSCCHWLTDGYAGLNENGPTIGSCIWILGLQLVDCLGRIGGVALQEGACQGGWALVFQNHTPFLALSTPPACVSRGELSATASTPHLHAYCLPTCLPAAMLSAMIVVYLNPLTLQVNYFISWLCHGIVLQQ